MDDTEIWFQADETRLYAVERGRGEPVIFLHGGLGDHQASALRLGGLAATHRLVMPDARGAGRSRYGGELTWARLADDVLALLDHLGLGDAVIGGMSAGSAIALTFALRHPERTRALLLVSPVFAGTRRGLVPAQRAAFERMGAVGREVLAEGIGALEPLYAALPAPIREAAQAMARSFDPASVAATTRFLAQGVHPIEELGELARLRMPALIVPGTDPEHPAELAADYAAAIEGSTLADPSADLATTVAAFLRR